MTVEKSLPFGAEVLHDIADTYGTPVYVYDEAGIRANAQRVNAAFGWNPEYVNHFAVKATPIPGILRVVQGEEMGFDCSSITELRMVQEQVGRANSSVFYTSNNTPDRGYQYADAMDAVINVDKLPYVAQVFRALGHTPRRMAIRYNPGPIEKGSAIIGDPQEQKFGDTEEHVLKALTEMQAQGVEEIGLHAMVRSNEQDPEWFGVTARNLRILAEKASGLAGVSVDFINVGGGLGVNYHPDEIPVDVESVGQAVEAELARLGIPIYSEHGRYVTGPNGYMLTRVTHGIVDSYKAFLQVDTSINNMARLATVTAAYHELSVIGRDGDEATDVTVVGSMCANTDQMFKDRKLPVTTKPGDLMVIHDAGAHMQANSHNYNGIPRAGGVMVRTNGEVVQVIFPETEDDILARTAGL